MPAYEIEVNRMVEYKGTVIVEASDPNEAHDIAQAKALLGNVAMSSTSEETYFVFMGRVGPTEAEQAAEIEEELNG